MGETADTETRGVGRWFLPALIFSRLGTRPYIILMAILLVEMAASFDVPVGVMGQMRSVASLLAMGFALVMGVLSIRFRPKPLLLVGGSLFVVSALGCSFAPSYAVMLVFFSLTGFGSAIVAPMSQTLVGEHLDVEERPRAFSYMFVTFTLVSALVASPVLNWLAVRGGWRLAYLAYVLPFAVLGLVAAYLGIPASGPKSGEAPGLREYLAAFREILSDRSSLTCILCSMLVAAAFTSISIYGVSAFIERFGVPSAWRGNIWSILTFVGAIGSFLSSRLVARFGRKPVCFAGALTMGVCAVGFSTVDGVWLSLGLAVLCGFGQMIWSPASLSLTLEQNLRLRGSMMSLNEAARSLGVALGSGLGGYLLLESGYSALGLVLGSIGVVAAVIHRLFTVDPTKS
jgi:predicted MFS family arabinose efflux permease